ncbi:DUF1801 domain-containing protein [Ulvibacter antarcticus]|uniref:Uncharacterized protein DUF1801 n=1 Tax=Ulvibacter antarcticus TaxID=442714 RepID=A0A3L9YB96_9FLAO|nr:DUF1801 domain-containing protein [Ulvibacter antarcticus]RMA56747.1 uncharacterized protein DUF1801 [Ulvibacter antarcticus]
MNPAAHYILQQPEPQRAILLHLQLVIEAIVPEAVMLYKYKIPFYYIHGKRPFCYLNCTKGYVDLGFWNAAHLTKHTSEMISEGRKHMKSLRYLQLSDINDLVLTEVLSEAYLLKDKKYYK